LLILIVKWIHILTAIVAVGANLTYGIWLGRAEREPKALPFVLRNIRWIDRRLANPGYGLLLITGLIMAFLIPIPLTTPWLLTALILYVLAAALGGALYAPAMRAQVRALEEGGFESQEYQAASGRGRTLGIIVTLDVLIIVFLMVVKPALWG
jgi:uncharacterized membrane protein